MGNLFDRACKFAVESHKGQLRKNGQLFILHPQEVTTIAGTMTNDENVLAAAVLHDVPEECNMEIAQIIKEFGKKVGTLVALETETKYLNLSSYDSWMLRKKEAIDRLQTTKDINFKILYLSDKLANIRSLYEEFIVDGYSIFDKFNMKDPTIQAWYYYSVLENISELKEYSAYKEYEYKINIIFNGLRKENNDGKSIKTP